MPSFFDCMTLIAFLYFSDQKVDLAIVETGLGGRLDPTNIITPEVSVITSIGLDHTEVLGSTLSSIAKEKAGIIKENIPVVVGKLPFEAEAVIRKIAKSKKSPLYTTAEMFGSNLLNYPQTNLFGHYQRQNAASATLVTEILNKKFSITSEKITSALMNVYWPGRWQSILLDHNKQLILDASHNEEGAQVLEENLTDLFNITQKKPIIIVGFSTILRAQAILPVISRFAKHIILTKSDSFKSIDPNPLMDLIPSFFPRNEISIVPLCSLFQKNPFFGNSSEIIIATGSIYLVGNILNLLTTKKYNK